MRRIDWTAIGFTLLAVLGAAAAAAVVFHYAARLMPPDRLVFAAGGPGGAYHAIASRYRGILARDGVIVEILETKGSVDNARALAEGQADVALLQGGVDPPADAPVEALAAVFLEPLLVFTRGPAPEAADPAAWAGLRIAIGPPGSGTRAAVLASARALGLTPPSESLLPLGGADAAEALLAGEIDAAVFVAPIDAPYLREILREPSIPLAPVRDPAALARRTSFIRLADVPAGAFDYAQRLPPERVELPAMVGRLAAREELHPALVNRLALAAREIHGGADLLTPEGTFPSTEGLAMPVNKAAAKLIENGPSALEQVLPYWIVAQIDRFVVLLAPLILLGLPLLRALPGFYASVMRKRVWRKYESLLEIDAEAAQAETPEAVDALESRLDAMEAEIRDVSVPLRYRPNAYALRQHVVLLRRALEERRAQLARG